MNKIKDSNKVLKANLSNAELSEAILYRANLSGANLTRAKLCIADLRHSSLNEVDFSDANLIAANLFETNLDKARNLDPNQIVNKAINWDKAYYDPEFDEQLKQLKKLASEASHPQGKPTL